MYTTEKLDNNKYQIKITISPEEWEKYVNQAYEENKGKFNVQGFRKGKAPRKVIEQNYGANVFFDDAIDIGFSKEYYDCLTKEKEIEPIDNPELKIEKFDESGLVILATVPVVPKVTLGQYKGLEIKKHEHTLDETKVDKELEQVRQRQARFVTVERPSQLGDIVTLDFSGSVDGKKFEGGTAEGHRLELGSHTFIDNFEDQLVGLNIGQRKDVVVTFPKNYGVAELNGKQATFDCLISKIEEKQLPQLNDEFASNVSDFETLEEYKQDIKKHLQESLDAHNKQENENNLIEAVVNNAQVDVPEVLVERQLDMFIRDFEMRLGYQGMKLDDYLAWSGTTIQDLKKERHDQAVQTVKTRLVLEELIKQEKLEVTDAEIDAKIADLATKYKKDVADYKKSLGEKQLLYFENEILMNKVIDFLMKNNKLV